MDTNIAPELWFGREQIKPAPSATCQGSSLAVRPIHIKHTPGSGWKFDVVTGAGINDANAMGEIYTTTHPANRDPYASLMYLPTMLSSSVKAGQRIEASMQEFLFYIDFLHKVRAELVEKWPALRVSPKRQNQLAMIIDEIRTDLGHRQTDLPLQAIAIHPKIEDSRGRPNPGAASAKLTAMDQRLGEQVRLEQLGVGSMNKRQNFATTLMQCYMQDIWDMRHMEHLQPKPRERALNRRINRAIIKPMLFAGLYCHREFGDNLGHPLVLPRIIEVFMAEVQLMAIRDLFAGLEQRPTDHKETLYKLRLLLLLTPNEKLYSELFDRLSDFSTEIGKAFVVEPDSVKKLAKQAKLVIRDRAVNNSNHPWYVGTRTLPQP